MGGVHYHMNADLYSTIGNIKHSDLKSFFHCDTTPFCSVVKQSYDTETGLSIKILSANAQLMKIILQLLIAFFSLQHRYKLETWAVWHVWKSLQTVHSAHKSTCHQLSSPTGISLQHQVLYSFTTSVCRSLVTQGLSCVWGNKENIKPPTRVCQQLCSHHMSLLSQTCAQTQLHAFLCSCLLSSWWFMLSPGLWGMEVNVIWWRCMGKVDSTEKWVGIPYREERSERSEIFVFS